MAETLKFGLIGCGFIAKVHAANIHKIDGMEVVAWCDLAKEKAEEFLSKYGGRYATTDASEIMEDSRIDAVAIATALPDDCASVNADLAIRAARAGKHVFMEKPIAATLEKADEVVSAIRETGVKFQLGFCFQYSPTIERAARIMPNPAYSVFQCAETLTAQACHNIDLMVHKFHKAPLLSVYASGGKYFDFDQRLPIDSFSAVLRFEDGSTSTYTQHGAMNVKLSKFSAQLFGKEGCVYLGDRFREVLWFPADGEPPEPYRDEETYMGHFQEIEDFGKCIRANRTPANTPERGRFVLAVEKGIIESATTGQVIDMTER